MSSFLPRVNNKISSAAQEHDRNSNRIQRSDSSDASSSAQRHASRDIPSKQSDSIQLVNYVASVLTDNDTSIGLTWEDSSIGSYEVPPSFSVDNIPSAIAFLGASSHSQPQVDNNVPSSFIVEDRPSTEALLIASPHSQPLVNNNVSDTGIDVTQTTKVVVKRNDVLFGIGGKIDKHPGNVQYRNDSDDTGIDVTQTTKVVVKSDDVLFGIGGKIDKHPGNVLYRNESDELRIEYQKIECGKTATSSRRKREIAKELVGKVHARDGRFLQRDTHGNWYVVSPDRAMEKAAQRLREKPKRKHIFDPGIR